MEEAFPTDLGWLELRWRGEKLADLRFGARSARPRRGRVLEPASRGGPPDSHSGHLVGSLQQRLVAYAAGGADRHDFRDLRLDLRGLTLFQRRVLACCRKIPRGQTCSYAQLAAAAGFPRAARAVGQVMARNRWPLIVPCHRVVPSGGGLGNYSGPAGAAMKRRLLELEGALP